MFFIFLSEPLSHGFAVTAFYAVASVGAGRSPPETSTPFRGERVPVGGRSPVENSAVASDIAERAPLGHSNRSDPFSFVNSVVAGRVPPAHSNRADRRDRWCEPFSAVASGAKRRKPWLSWRIVLHRPNRQVRPLLGVPHRGTATEPTGEKGKKLVLIISPLNSNLPN